MTDPNILVRPSRKAVLAALALGLLPGIVIAAGGYDTEHAVRELERLREQDLADRERSDRLRMQQEALASQDDAIRRLEQTRQRIAESSREAAGLPYTGPDYMYVYPAPGGIDNGLASPQLPGTHPLAGMEFATISPGLGRYFGVDRGVLVVRSGAGASWGLQDGDVVLAVDGRAATAADQLGRILRSYQPGEQFKLSVQRNNKPVDISASVPRAR